MHVDLRYSFRIFLSYLLLHFINGQGNRNFKAKLLCTETELVVLVTSTEGVFSGVVYTEGSYKDPECHREIKEEEQLTFHIPYHKCKTEQKDGKYTNTLVIQHHERIMTADDAAFKVMCDRKNPKKDSEIIVTESMYMVHDNHQHKKPEEEKTRPIKELYNDKKIKTVYNDKETYTYVKSKNKTLDSLNQVYYE